MGKRGPDKSGLNNLKCVKNVIRARRHCRFVKKHKQILSAARRRLDDARCGNGDFHSAASDYARAEQCLRRRAEVSLA